MKRKHGFTLIELLVVLTIVALLAGVALPNYARSVTRMRRIEGETALIEAMQQQEAYRTRHNTYVAFSADAPSGMRWWSGRDPASSAYEIDGHACEGAPLADCIELRARPGTARVNGRATDAECGALTLDSRGQQGAEGPARCWP